VLALDVKICDRIIVRNDQRTTPSFALVELLTLISDRRGKWVQSNGNTTAQNTDVMQDTSNIDLSNHQVACGNVLSGIALQAKHMHRHVTFPTLSCLYQR
jgi:hypothetical protein